MWLYDPITEDFRRVPGIPPWQRWEIRYRASRAFLQPPHRSRRGRLVYWLFEMGAMCPLAIGGLMVLTIIAWLSGYR
jgi:hypothetical protein